MNEIKEDISEKDIAVQNYINTHRVNGVRYRIPEMFSETVLKKMFLVAMDVTINDNNIKAELIIDILRREYGEDAFSELGTGTNRTALLSNSSNLVCKIALDRNGFYDNMTEFKRSPELDMYCAKAYETNFLILISEYVVLMSEEEFRNSKTQILTILEDLSRAYIIGDVGYINKNRCNYGYRDLDKSIVILDYGYVYPKYGQDNALICPKCKHPLKYTDNYSGFLCTNPRCSLPFTFSDVRRKMNKYMDEIEDGLIGLIADMEMPDLSDINNFNIQK